MNKKLLFKMLIVVSFFSPVEAKNASASLTEETSVDLSLDKSFEEISIELVNAELKTLKKNFIDSAECKASRCLSSIATSRCDKIVKSIATFKNIIQDVNYNLDEGIMSFSDSQKDSYQNFKMEFDKLSKDSVFICGSGS